MVKNDSTRLPLSLLALVSVIILGTIFFIVKPGTLSGFVSTTDFQPHAFCFTWQPDLMLLYVVSDSFITFSYIFISAVLVFFVYRTRDNLPMPWIFLAFGAFIVSCGITHFFDILTLWDPIYWISGTAKLITAIASSLTAFSLPYAVPRALKLVKEARLSTERKHSLIASNQELQREILRRKQIEIQLIEALAAERTYNQLQKNFIATMSHEFRTPLAIIMTSSQILERYNQNLTNEQKTEKFNTIKQQIKHIDLMLNEILSVQKIESDSVEFTPTPVNLTALLENSISDIQATFGARHIISFEQTGCAREVVADEKLLQTVILNLLQNAIKYSPEASQIFVNLVCDSEFAVITVKDEGMGISEEEQTNIFKAFFRGADVSHIPGTGLGLAIVKNTVDLHKGEIKVESQIGQGSTFSVQIPLVRA